MIHRRTCVPLAFVLMALLFAGLPGRAAAQQPGVPDGNLNHKTFLPLVSNRPPYRCPSTSSAQYAAIPYEGPPSDRPPARHADLNLGLRGYAPVQAPLQLIDYGGAVDPLAPQMRGIFASARTPRFTSAHQVYSWDWACGPDGCRGPLLSDWPVTLLGMRVEPGETLAPPARAAEIYPGGYVALVLYAEPNRITLKYTREDNVVRGYTVHVENVCVDPNLLALYNALNAARSPQLPALRNSQPFGTARTGEIAVAVRDCGNFMDPRSRKDWWATP